MCNSSIVKSPSLSTISTLSRWKPRFLKYTRPLSLDLSYTYPDEAFVQSSNDTIPDASIAEAEVSNELPLPPRCPKKRPLRGTKPPPRHLIGPKPPKFMTISDKDENAECMEDKQHDTKLSTDKKDAEVSIDKNKNSELYPDTEGEKEDGDDSPSENEAEDVAESDYTNLEEMKQNWLNVPNSKSETTDSKFEATDQISESSTDTTVVTAIEVKAKMQVYKHASVSRETSRSTVSTDSIYELYDTPISKTSGIDYTKLSKDIQNKMSKESQRSAKNLAAEISDFFKISASKLRPPCLHSRKVTAIEEVVVKSIPEPQSKVRLIPRSPYIAPVKFEHVVHRTQPKHSPFWEVNPNKGDVTSLTYSKSLSPINSWCDTKAMKNLENAARKKLLIRDGDISEPITRSEKKAYEDRATHTFITRSEQHTHKLMARDLKLKSRLYLSMNDKIVTKLPTESNRSTETSNKLQEAMSPESLITQYSLDNKITAKNRTKVIMPPVPRITLRMIKTQLPCDIPDLIPKTIDSLLNKSVNRSTDSTDKSSLLRDKTAEIINRRRTTYMRYIRRQQKIYNEHHQNVDEFADIVFNYRPDNTWPPKIYRSRKK